ncbi:MAG: tetratricopeptide repeat protein [Elusimicrobiota bacterium]
MNFKKTIMIPLSFLFLMPSISFSQKSIELDAARNFIKSGSYKKSLELYNKIAKRSPNASLISEYAYVLALNGLLEPSLSQLDRAIMIDVSDKDTRYFMSKIFSAVSLNDVATEIIPHSYTPSWLINEATLNKLSHERQLSESFMEALDIAEGFMRQSRYASAIDAFGRIIKKWPDEYMGYSGYAIALEKIGAYKTASKAVEMAVLLMKKNGKPINIIRKFSEYGEELKNKPPLVEKKLKDINMALKGKYFAFAGGNFTHTETDSVFNINTRLGKFITNNFDLSLNLGFTTGYEISDYNGLSIGVSGRLNKPITQYSPIRLTAAARLALEPSPEDNFSFILSPGLSYFTPSGSIDVFVDFNLTGPYKGTQVLSIGYTTYFGGGR